MKGDSLKKLRARREWSQSELATVLNTALGTNYGAGSVSPWENDRRPVPAAVASFVEELLLDAALAVDDDEPIPPTPEGETDTAPGPGGAVMPGPQAPLGGPSIYARACEDLWEMIGTGVGMVGAATGNMALMGDGAIIAADKEALGKAWGKLAETNDTFRKMLVGMTEGGAWLHVALVTGTTFSNCYQANHAPRMIAPAPRDDDGAAGVHAVV